VRRKEGKRGEGRRRKGAEGEREGREGRISQ